LKKMTGFRAAAAALLLLGLAAATAAGTYAARGSDDNSPGDRNIAMRDDCDPTDETWTEVGGCLRKQGNVTRAEFFAAAGSPLSAAVVGHPAWRNSPSYLVIKEGGTVRVRNAGGRGHTFTEVKAFGGGTVPPLNQGLTPAPECPLAIGIAPGESVELSGLAVGDHLFQCCLHPWMRAQISVKPKSSGGHDHH
jgi:plastocyanin